MQELILKSEFVYRYKTVKNLLLLNSRAQTCFEKFTFISKEYVFLYGFTNSDVKFIFHINLINWKKHN